MDDDHLARGRAILASQPFSVLLGAELLHLSSARTAIRLPLRPDLLQQHGVAHGGVVAYLADNAKAFAGGCALGGGVVTAAVTVSYLRPGRGHWLEARAHVVHHGRSQAVCRCEVLAVDRGEERLCAVAQGTVVKPPAAAPVANSG